jgi:CubicO group peptidase (beta-lactamase class C family)
MRFACCTRCLVIVSLILDCFAAAAEVNAQETPGQFWTQAESPEDRGWNSEALQKARDFSNSIDTAAVMVIHDGVVIDQWGATALPLRCHSVRKSLLSAMYGRFVADGTIDLDAELKSLGIDDNAPSLDETERTATVSDLLKSRSGIYHPALYETAAMAARRPQRGSHPPGTFWYYNNWDFNALATIFETCTSRSLFKEFDEQIAAPLQMEDFSRERHTQYFRGADSIHPAYPFQLSTRDLARFGLLMMRNGRWGNRQLVPADWVKRSTQSYSDTGESGGYGFMWWVANRGQHFTYVKLPDRSFSARGHRGQFLVVIPEWELVIVHRVNSFQDGTSVSRHQFGRLLKLILAARPDTPDAEHADASSTQCCIHAVHNTHGLCTFPDRDHAGRPNGSAFCGCTDD